MRECYTVVASNKETRKRIYCTLEREKSDQLQQSGEDNELQEEEEQQQQVGMVDDGVRVRFLFLVFQFLMAHRRVDVRA